MRKSKAEVKTERIRRWKVLRKRGFSYAEIADLENPKVTRQAVSQALKRAMA